MNEELAFGPTNLGHGEQTITEGVSRAVEAVNLGGLEDYLMPAEHSVYDHVIYDSEIERRFVNGLEHRDDVTPYVKLPSWFTVPTPVGEYDPD